MKKHFKNIIFPSIIIYIIIYSYYIFVSNGLAAKEIFLQMRRFIPCILSISFVLYITKYKITNKYFMSPAIIGLLWILVSPITYYLTYQNTATFISNHFDIAFGIYIFAILSLAKIFIDLKFSTSKKIIYIFTFIQFILTIIPIFSIFYYLFYQTAISYNGILAIYQTNIPEAIEYMKSIPKTYIIGLFSFLLLLFYVFFKNNIKYQYTLSLAKTIYLPSLVLIILSVYTFSNLLFKTYVISTAIDVKNYFISIQKYNEFHENNLDSLYVNSKNKLNKPHTIVLVIGESESRDLMHCYVGDKVRNNTPWFDEQKNNPNFIFFNNAYACWVQTVPVLERALTEKNQYNQLQFNNSFSIIDIAKKAGYKTYWFSNQGFIGSADTPITIVAQSADISKWTSNENNIIQYDESLLKFIDNIDPNQNNFIVFHIMGCHANYESRYPKERMIWGNENYTLLDGNDNSIAYTDYVLSEIYDKINKKTNLASMIYFSDHGSDPKLHRHPDKLNYYTIHIPLVIYLSDEYIKTNNLVSKTIINNKDEYFSNDLIYNLICSVLNVESNHFNESESIASPKYMYNKYNLKTMLGKMYLSEDETKK